MLNNKLYTILNFTLWFELLKEHTRLTMIFCPSKARFFLLTWAFSISSVRVCFSISYLYRLSSNFESSYMVQRWSNSYVFKLFWFLSGLKMGHFVEHFRIYGGWLSCTVHLTIRVLKVKWSYPSVGHDILSPTALSLLSFNYY